MSNYRNNKNLNTIGLILFSYIIFLTVGFSSLSSDLSMNATAVVRIQKDIRVTEVKASNVASSAYSNWEDYNVNGISASAALPNRNSSITYDVKVTNIGNAEMVFYL